MVRSPKSCSRRLLTHTVALPAVGAARVKPLSVWLLERASAGQQWWLISAERDLDGPARLQRLASAYLHHLRFNYRGRAQVGASQPPARPSPAGLAAAVAEQQRPAVWVEPLRDPAGFRALLPHRGPDCGIYVAAISDIRYTVPAPPLLTYRTDRHPNRRFGRMNPGLNVTFCD